MTRGRDPILCTQRLSCGRDSILPTQRLLCNRDPISSTETIFHIIFHRIHFRFEDRSLADFDCRCAALLASYNNFLFANRPSVDFQRYDSSHVRGSRLTTVSQRFKELTGANATHASSERYARLQLAPRARAAIVTHAFSQRHARVQPAPRTRPASVTHASSLRHARVEPAARTRRAGSMHASSQQRARVQQASRTHPDTVTHARYERVQPTLRTR